MVEHGDADNFASGIGQLVDLRDGGIDVAGIGIGHGLNADGKATADDHRADFDGAAFPSGGRV